MGRGKYFSEKHERNYCQVRSKAAARTDLDINQACAIRSHRTPVVWLHQYFLLVGRWRFKKYLIAGSQFGHQSGRNCRNAL